MQGWWVASYVVLWLLVVVLAIVVVALARQIGTLHLRLGPQGALEIDTEGPPLDEAPPLFDAHDTDGRRAVVGGPGQPSLLLFASPGCIACEQVLPGLRTVASRAGARALVLSDLDPDEARVAFSDVPAPLVASPEIARAYGVPGTPFAVYLDDLGVVRAKGTPNNLEQLEGLVDTGRRRQSEAESERRAS